MAFLSSLPISPVNVGYLLLGFLLGMLCTMALCKNKRKKSSPRQARGSRSAAFSPTEQREPQWHDGANTGPSSFKRTLQQSPDSPAAPASRSVSHPRPQQQPMQISSLQNPSPHRSQALPEKYKIITRLVSQGLEPEEIANILEISLSEAQQVTKLIRTTPRENT